VWNRSDGGALQVEASHPFPIGFQLFLLGGSHSTPSYSNLNPGSAILGRQQRNWLIHCGIAGKCSMVLGLDR